MAEEQPSIQIDTDWKKQAQEEKRRLAEQQKQETPPPAEGGAPAATATAPRGGGVAGCDPNRSGRFRRDAPTRCATNAAGDPGHTGAVNRDASAVRTWRNRHSRPGAFDRPGLGETSHRYAGRA